MMTMRQGHCRLRYRARTLTTKVAGRTAEVFALPHDNPRTTRAPQFGRGLTFRNRE